MLWKLAKWQLPVDEAHGSLTPGLLVFLQACTLGEMSNP